ncbi:MAG: deoxyribonuclease I [Thiohalocapsa sp. PB-PSB1]|jgi:deoxyribonuclease-1|nr:MAG: deoxyribonuclease I [Thiohalocapsa sp. PB-PSB1]
MPRQSKARRARATSNPNNANHRWRGSFRLLLGKLRDLAIGLGLVSAISFVPPSMVQQWPERAQTAMTISVDIRSLVLEITGDLAQDFGDGLEGFGSLVADSAGDAMSELIADLLPPELIDWLPWTGVRPVPPGHAPRVAASYGAAKQLLYERVYRSQRRSFYCGCSFDGDGRPSLSSCGLQALAGQTRADRIEAEHLFPSSRFGKYRGCWRNPGAYSKCRKSDGGLLSGRSCCLRVDKTFIAAHNDLHNLVPAVGLINAQRSDYDWGKVSGGKRYGACEIRIDSGIRRVQPPIAVRGDIARVMFYMQDTYGFRLSYSDHKMYAEWNNIDPPTAQEIKRDRRIARLQGKHNDYVAAYRKLRATAR